jgi:sugar lactone lactonase YvrE
MVTAFRLFFAQPSIFVRHRQLPMVLLLALTTALGAHAQGVGFNGFQMTLAGQATNGLNHPQGVAVDANGTVYVADYGNNRVLKVPPTDLTCATASDCTTVVSNSTNGSNFAPFAIAVDASLNLYVADGGNNRVVKVPSTCTSSACQTTVAAGLSSPQGVAVDASGNVYIADYGNNRVVQVPWNSGTSSYGTPITLGGSAVSGLQGPFGMAVDAGGNVYITYVLSTNLVLKLLATDLSCTVISDCTQVASQVTNGLNKPYGVAVDGNGFVYIADAQNSRVLKVPATDLTCSNAVDCTTAGNSLNSPSGVAVDGNGNVYIANTGNNQAVKVAQDVDFGQVSVATTTPASRTLTYTLSGSDCSAASSVKVLTQGAPNKDFIFTAGNSSCTPGTPTVFSLVVNLTPRFAGLRTGAVQLTDSSGNVQATTYLHGIGTGPQITWTPGVQTAVVGSTP